MNWTFYIMTPGLIIFAFVIGYALGLSKAFKLQKQVERARRNTYQNILVEKKRKDKELPNG